MVVVYAKTDPAAGPRGITAFIVEKGWAGLHVRAETRQTRHAWLVHSELVFDNCLVPAENVLGEFNGGVRVLMKGLDYERAVLGGGPLGLMAAALDLVLPYVHERKQFGQAIGTFGSCRPRWRTCTPAERGARLFVCHWPRLRCRPLFAPGRGGGHPVRRGSGHAGLPQAIQALGGNGYINDYAAGRLLRDAKLYEIGAGTQEIRRMLIGREIYEATA